MTEEQIAFYAECRVHVSGNQRIRTTIEERDGKRLLMAKTSLTRSHLPRWVSIELHPEAPPGPIAYRSAALVLAGHWSPSEARKVRVR